VLRSSDRGAPAHGPRRRAARRAGLDRRGRLRRGHQPVQREGIAYAYETGRLAAAAVSDALGAGDPRLLASYEASLQEIYGMYYRVARAFIGVLSRPGLMRLFVNTGIYSRPVMEFLLRIMGNYLRPDELGAAEAVYGPSPPWRVGCPSRRRLSPGPRRPRRRSSEDQVRPGTLYRPEMLEGHGLAGSIQPRSAAAATMEYSPLT